MEIHFDMDIVRYLSVPFIEGAVRFANLSRISESDAAFSEAQHLQNVVAALVFSVMYLEATVSELFRDVVMNPVHGMAIENLDPCVTEQLKMAAQHDLLPRDTLGKYQLVLLLSGKEQFDIGRSPYQDTALLVRLRNSLVHYRQSWVRVAGNVRGAPCSVVESRLAGRFDLNRKPSTGSAFFPDRCLGWGCSKWAVKTSLDFVDEFYRRMGADPLHRFSMAQGRLFLE